MSYLLSDILESEKAKKDFLKYLAEKPYSADRNRLNYESLPTTLDRFISFHILQDSRTRKIVCFGGMMSARYPDGCVRILSRYFKDPQYRSTGLSPSSHIGVKFIGAAQVSIAKRLGYRFIFTSVEFQRRNRAAKSLAEILELHTSSPWSCLEGLYYTCRTEKGRPLEHNESCWQNIVLLKNREGIEDEFPLPKR